jgi:DNA mismatch endonuclease (patch repair protein)
MIMADVHTSAIRSKNMRAIRHKDTKPELLVRKALFERGFRYRLNDSKLPGKPDLVFTRYKAVILIHGCFWHGHGCHLFRLPGTRPQFWRSKIDSNKSRDIIVLDSLRAAGWRVGIVWECTLKGRFRKELCRVSDELATWLADSRTPTLEITGTDGEGILSA